MSTINVNKKEISLKLVYYGPGLSGKTTSLEAIHKTIPEARRPKLVSVATEEERTLFCDFLPLNIAKAGEYMVRLQLYTVPGQIFYNSTRRLVLRGADGVIFVADSQAALQEANVESLESLNDNLESWGQRLAELPHVIQYNKRDLPEVCGIADMNARLNVHEAPYFETVASTGYGTYEALKEITRLSVRDLASKRPLLELQKKAGQRAKEMPAPQAPSAPRKRATTEGGSPRRSIAAALKGISPAQRETSGAKAMPQPAPAPSPPAPSPATPAPSIAAPRERSPAGVSFAEFWKDSTLKALATEAEELIGSGRYGDSVVKSAQIMSLATQQAGHGRHEEAFFALISGVNGTRYQRFRDLVKLALVGQELDKHAALFAIHFVTEFALLSD